MIAAAQRKWLALGLLLGVQFMVVLDIAIVNVALPSIQKDLGFSERNLQWIVSASAGPNGAISATPRRVTCSFVLDWRR